jgi:hypothetical protein
MARLPGGRLAGPRMLLSSLQIQPASAIVGIDLADYWA